MSKKKNNHITSDWNFNTFPIIIAMPHNIKSETTKISVLMYRFSVNLTFSLDVLRFLFLTIILLRHPFFMGLYFSIRTVI